MLRDVHAFAFFMTHKICKLSNLLLNLQYSMKNLHILHIYLCAIIMTFVQKQMANVKKHFLNMFISFMFNFV